MGHDEFDIPRNLQRKHSLSITKKSRKRSIEAEIDAIDEDIVPDDESEDLLPFDNHSSQEKAKVS